VGVEHNINKADQIHSMSTLKIAYLRRFVFLVDTLLFYHFEASSFNTYLI